MDFQKLLSSYSSERGRIKFKPSYPFIMGSGGSNNLIYVGKKYAYKIIPYEKKKYNQKKRNNSQEREIDFYRYFTQDVIITNKSPHIVGYYDRYKIPLKQLLSKAKCLTYDQRLFERNFTNICKVQEIGQRFASNANVLVLEKCTHELGLILEKIRKISSGQYILKYILFQVIFTLAILQEEYPGFVHNDFYVRNILAKCTYDSNNSYHCYHYKGLRFYLPASGVFIKINDFGFSLSRRKIVSDNIHFSNQSYSGIALGCEKCDVFNLLFDILSRHYRGASWAFKNVLGEFINIKKLQTIKNSDLLKDTWNIKKSDFLKSTILTPEQYLLKNFKDFRIKPTNGKIIQHFGNCS